MCHVAGIFHKFNDIKPMVKIKYLRHVCIYVGARLVGKQIFSHVNYIRHPLTYVMCMAGFTRTPTTPWRFWVALFTGAAKISWRLAAQKLNAALLGTYPLSSLLRGSSIQSPCFSYKTTKLPFTSKRLFLQGRSILATPHKSTFSYNFPLGPIPYLHS